MDWSVGPEDGLTLKGEIFFNYGWELKVRLARPHTTRENRDIKMVAGDTNQRQAGAERHGRLETKGSLRLPLISFTNPQKTCQEEPRRLQPTRHSTEPQRATV